MKTAQAEEMRWENEIDRLLNDPEYAEHPLRAALDEVYSRYVEQINSLEKLTSISDGFQSVLRESNTSLNDRYRQQIRQLQKIIRISDHYQRMLQDTNEKLKIASSFDSLTNLPNRRFMQERLDAETAKAIRGGKSFSLALIDVDHFKQINDGYGHNSGDAVLVSLSRAFKQQLRPYDICARWGGEEFLVLLPDTTGPAATEISNRLCARADTLDLPDLPDEIQLSVSVGVAVHVVGKEWDETLKHADDALYEAKHGGRNRVALYGKIAA